MSNKNMALSNAMSDGSFGELTGMTKWEAKRDASLAVKQTLVAATHEQGRAYLTNMALENTGALSALEGHLTQIAPNGAERYRHIVDAYALGAAQKIAGW